MRYFLLTLSLLLTNVFNAQQITILESKTKDPIPTANIYFYKDSKNVLAASTNDSGQVTYNQDYDYFVVSFVGYKDKKYKKRRDETVTIYLEEDVKKLKEVVVKADNRKVLIGEYKSNSTQSVVIGKKQNYGILLFPPDTTTNFKLYSIYLNLKKVPLKSKIRIAFYHTTTHDFTYTNRKKKTYTATEIIPDIKQEIGHLDYMFSPNNEKQIIEIKADSTLIVIPKTGIFVSAQTLALFDENNKEYTSTNPPKFPILYFHTTRETNYCIIENRVSPPEWRNHNKREQEYNKANNDHFIFPQFDAPSIGLKIMENRIIPEEMK